MESRISTELTGSPYDPVASSCEHGAETSVSVKGGGFLN
jgi:hypothetical protein